MYKFSLVQPQIHTSVREEYIYIYIYIYIYMQFQIHIIILDIIYIYIYTINKDVCKVVYKLEKLTQIPPAKKKVQQYSSFMVRLEILNNKHIYIYI